MWKTLIPVDGSPNSQRAVQYAADSVKRYPDQEFILLNVQPPFPLRAHASMSHEEIQRAAGADGDKVLNPARAVLDQAGARYEAHCVSGDIEDVICAQVEQNGCNAVIMGTRGMGAAGNLLLGSVATKILHAVKVPVTLVK